MPQVIEAVLKPSITLDEAEQLIESFGDMQIVQAAEDENTKQACIWVTHEDNRKDYLHALRSSGMFQRTEYVDDPTSLDTSCSCS